MRGTLVILVRSHIVYMEHYDNIMKAMIRKYKVMLSSCVASTAGLFGFDSDAAYFDHLR
jgi:hypothetical protein